MALGVVRRVAAQSRKVCRVLSQCLEDLVEILLHRCRNNRSEPEPDIRACSGSGYRFDGDLRRSPIAAESLLPDLDVDARRGFAAGYGCGFSIKNSLKNEGKVPATVFGRRAFRRT